MKLRFERRTKESELPAWPFVGLGVGLLILAAWIVTLLPARWFPPCGFHTVTGHPCPSCGGTRMMFLFLRGHPLDAFKMNPLFASLLAGFAAWFFLGTLGRLAGYDFRIDVGRREEKWLWLALLAGFLVNWAYLWNAGV
jgi:hypothetical protein